MLGGEREGFVFGGGGVDGGLEFGGEKGGEARAVDAALADVEDAFSGWGGGGHGSARWWGEVFLRKNI